MRRLTRKAKVTLQASLGRYSTAAFSHGSGKCYEHPILSRPSHRPPATPRGAADWAGGDGACEGIVARGEGCPYARKNSSQSPPYGHSSANTECDSTGRSALVAVFGVLP